MLLVRVALADQRGSGREVSDTVTGLAAALVAAQAEMPAVEPDAVNPHFKTRFVSLDHLIAKTRPVLNRHGLALVQLPATSDLGLPVLRTTLIHGPTGEQVSADTPLILQKQDMQAFGAAITYARRYAWAAALGIASDEDSDGSTPDPAPAPARGRARVPAPAVAEAGNVPDDDIPFEPPPPAGLDDRRRKRMMALFRERGFVDREQRLAFTAFMLGRQIESSTELTVEDADLLIATLEKQKSVKPPKPPDAP